MVLKNDKYRRIGANTRHRADTRTLQDIGVHAVNLCLLPRGGHHTWAGVRLQRHYMAGLSINLRHTVDCRERDGITRNVAGNGLSVSE